MIIDVVCFGLVVYGIFVLFCMVFWYGLLVWFIINIRTPYITTIQSITDCYKILQRNGLVLMLFWSVSYGLNARRQRKNY